MEDKPNLNFTDAEVIPANPQAEKFGKALADFLVKDEELELKKNGVPQYTGQWQPEHYYKDEQDARNRALDHLWGLIKNA